MVRLVVDIKFWRRFVGEAPQVSMDFLLGRLPRNASNIFRDACTSLDMAGVILLGTAEWCQRGLDGLSWQISLKDWQKRVPMRRLRSGSVEINLAEFLAAQLTCETFAAHCKGTLTSL